MNTYLLIAASLALTAIRPFVYTDHALSWLETIRAFFYILMGIVTVIFWHVSPWMILGSVCLGTVLILIFARASQLISSSDMLTELFKAAAHLYVGALLAMLCRFDSNWSLYLVCIAVPTTAEVIMFANRKR